MNSTSLNARSPCMAFIAIFISIIIASLGGCTRNIKTTASPVTQYSDSVLINLSVELNLTPEFTDFVRVSQAAGFTYNYKFQEDLFARSAEALAKSSFRKVSITNKKNQSWPKGIDAILTPSIVLMESENDGGFIRMNLILEWILVDTQGKVIWKHTILGTGSISGRKSTQAAIENAFRLSKVEISGSPAIASFANRLRAVQK